MTTSEPKKLIDRITQGEWTIGDLMPDGGLSVTPKDDGESCLCSVYGTTQDEYAANAEAIALVPKLLRENEQLREALKRFMQEESKTLSDCLCRDNGKCRFCEAKAALAGEGGK